MKDKYSPIKFKLLRIILLTSGVVLFLTCSTFFAYEFFTYRQVAKAHLSVLGQIIAANSTAALAFQSQNDAHEILRALKAEKHIVAACLYDENGKLFAKYPATLSGSKIPSHPGADGYSYTNAHLEGFEPVIQQEQRVGTLYIQSNMKAIYKRFKLYGLFAFAVGIIAIGVAYLLSRQLQRAVSDPILALAGTARAVSSKQDYRLRAQKFHNDELGELTVAFNQMLAQIERQNAEITSFNRDLERKVSERTTQAMDATKKLNILNDELSKSNRDLEQFAYIASHDLQEPLRKIQTYASILEKQSNDSTASATYISKIVSCVVRMRNLISSILNYSQTASIRGNFEKVDLNEVIEAIRLDYELPIAEKGAEINAEVLPVINGDKPQLTQLFVNLISNSLKFSQKTPEINISSSHVEEDELKQAGLLKGSDQYVLLLFKDNGIGFDQQFADKIFVIFQRFHSKNQYPGTGIGLALCKKIVENHHGHISVSSSLGEGTSFKIYLPLDQSPT